MTMIKLLNVALVTIEFKLIAITFIILTGIFFQNSIDPWYLILCCYQIFPFNSMNSNKGFFMCVNNFHNNTTTDVTLNNDSSLLSNPSENFKLLVNQFNITSPEYNTDPENIV